MRGPRQRRIPARCVDDQEIGVLGGGKGGLEPRQLFVFRRARQPGTVGEGIRLDRKGGGRAVCLKPGTTIGQESGQRPLAQVQIHDRDRMAGLHQTCEQVDGKGGLARPALFIADNDDPGHPRLPTLDPRLTRADRTAGRLAPNGQRGRGDQVAPVDAQKSPALAAWQAAWT